MAAKRLELYINNRDVIQRARIGDQLKFHRGWYSHWAVYIGNQEVIHIAGINSLDSTCTSNPSHLFTIGGKIFIKAEVKKESVWDVILGSKVEINNDKDKSCRPFRPHEIVRIAMGMIGDIRYNILWQNCEHFAAFCRYGVAWSKQADNALETIVVGGAIVTVAVLAYEFYMIFIKDD